MRWSGRRVAVYAHGVPTDMRKGFDSLCALVSEPLAKDPLNGDVFLFLSRNRIRAKVLHFDGTELCLYEALGRQALTQPVIHVDETRWPRLGSDAPAAGTVWGLATPTIAFYRILPGKSADEGRQFLGGYQGTVVVDGYAVYEVLARDGPGFALAHCWAHTKRKYDAIAEHWPTACAEIDELIGDLYAVERLVPGPFPGDAPAQALRQQLRQERSRPILDRIKTWATEQVGLPRSEFGKAVRYMLERWTGLTRFVDDPCIPLDNNSAERALRGPVVGRKRWLFIGHPDAGWRSAVIYTFILSCRRRGINPQEYLSDVLRRLPAMNITQIAQLLPGRWKAQPP